MKQLECMRLQPKNLGPHFKAESFSKTKSCYLFTCSDIHALPVENYRSQEQQFGTSSPSLPEKRKLYYEYRRLKQHEILKHSFMWQERDYNQFCKTSIDLSMGEHQVNCKSPQFAQKNHTHEMYRKIETQLKINITSENMLKEIEDYEIQNCTAV